MRIDAETVMPEHRAEAAWRLYTEAFAELRVNAVQRHVMFRHEFDDLMGDARVVKYLGVADDELSALATLTNDLDAVPLISPDYFEHRWPEHYADRRIWYVGFYAVHPRHRGTGLFERMIGAFHRVVAPSRGIAALDFCQVNEEVLRLPQAIHGVLSTFGDEVRSHRLDAQAYWCYEFPADS